MCEVSGGGGLQSHFIWSNLRGISQPYQKGPNLLFLPSSMAFCMQRSVSSSWKITLYESLPVEKNNPKTQAIKKCPTGVPFQCPGQRCDPLEFMVTRA